MSQPVELRTVLDQHKKWLADEENGKQATLRFANLRFANLREANLRYADLREADLYQADLRYANLREANLRYANLRGADLRGADLRSANLRFADLREADLRYADLRYANLCNSGLVLYQAGLWIAYIQRDVVRVGCQVHSISEWKSFSDEEIDRMDPNALEYWRNNRDIILEIAKSLESNENS